jgi:hypothetical protein
MPYTVHECYGFCEALRVGGFLESLGFKVTFPDEISEESPGVIFYTERQVRVQVDEGEVEEAMIALRAFTA